MSNIARAESVALPRRRLLGLLAATSMAPAFGQAAVPSNPDSKGMTTTSNAPLGAVQLAIGPIAAATATGDMPKLHAALEKGLDAGLTIHQVKEVLVQLYAYAGFPRSLNALGEFMKVLDTRRQRGLADAQGQAPGPLPAPERMLEVGTANQTKLSGAPVRGALFDFAPAVDQYLKTHLFGDIFARDNLDWSNRELATVAALSAISGVESQLLSHIRISMNVGLTEQQLRQFAAELSNRGEAQAGHRTQAALDKHMQAIKR